MNKPYTVVRTLLIGLMTVDIEMSKHATTKAAFRALHKLEKRFPDTEDSCLRVLNEKGNLVLEMKQRNEKGRWVTL